MHNSVFRCRRRLEEGFSHPDDPEQDIIVERTDDAEQDITVERADEFSIECMLVYMSNKKKIFYKAK